MIQPGSNGRGTRPLPANSLALNGSTIATPMPSVTSTQASGVSIGARREKVIDRGLRVVIDALRAFARD